VLVLLGHAHALVGPQLARDLGIGAERLADMRGDRGRSLTPREFGRAAIQLYEGALDFPLMGMLGEAG
jgi:hypothetical protein